MRRLMTNGSDVPEGRPVAERRPVLGRGAWVAGGLLALMLAALAAGCSNTGVVGRRVDNFTAYYNTFHNATTAFEKGVEQIEERNQEVDATVYLPLFLQPPEGASNTETFENVINKSADVLREHPTSKWVDDALLLIGKSYYYQGNDVGAEQKFQEVVNLGTDREGEARFWLARTLISSRQFEEAAKTLNASLADEQSDFGTWTDRMRLARAQLYVRQSRWEEAERALEQGLEGDLPGDLEARAWFLLGQVRETRRKPLEAADAYDEAAGANPRYELRYAAQLSAIRTRGLHGDTDKALRRLRGLERDDKNYEKRFEIRLLRARLQRAQGKPADARETLTGLMYGRERPSGDVQGRAHYALGVLYREAYNDFSSAAAHFDTASTSLQDPSAQDGEARQSTPAAIVDADQLAEQYGTLAERAQTVARLDSLIRLGKMPAPEFERFVAELRQKRRAEREAESESRRRRAEADRFQSRGATFDRNRGQDGGFDRQQAAATKSSESGFLYHQDAARVQEGKRSFERTWGRRPRVDNWRRIEAIRGQQTAGRGEEQRTERGPDAQTQSREALVDVSAVPRDSTSLAQMDAERALARYELANALFLSANRPDSAATWYRTIIQQDDEHPVARRALYALAEVRHAQGQTQRAEELYREVLDRYPTSEFAARARSRLGIEAQASTDSSAVLRSAYERAYRDWQSGALDTALTQMSGLAGEHPRSGVAPRAMLASGLIYLEQLRRDTSSARPEPLRRLIASAEPVVLDTQSPSGGGEEERAESASPDSPGPAADSAAARGTDPSRRTVRTPRRVSRDTAQADTATADADQPSPPRADTTQTTTPLTDSAVADTTVADTTVVDTTVADTTVADTAKAGTAKADTAKADTAKAAPDPMEPVVSLLELLTSAYGDTPQGERAQSMLTALRDRAASPDTTAADTTATDSLAADTAATDTAATDTTGRRPPARPERGERATWTIVAGQLDNVQAASRRADSLRAEVGARYAVDVQTVRTPSTQFRITLGRFDTQREAAAARARLRDALPEDASIEKRK